MTMIQVTCPHCGVQMSVSEGPAFQTVKLVSATATLEGVPKRKPYQLATEPEIGESDEV